MRIQGDVAPNRRASPSVTVCIASTGAARRRAIALQQQRRAGIGQRPALAQHGGERLGVAEAEIDALPGERMDAVRGVADQRHAMGDHRRQLLQLRAGIPALGVIDSSAPSACRPRLATRAASASAGSARSSRASASGADHTIDTRRPGSGSQARMPPSSRNHW